MGNPPPSNIRNEKPIKKPIKKSTETYSEKIERLKQEQDKIFKKGISDLKIHSKARQKARSAEKARIEKRDKVVSQDSKIAATKASKIATEKAKREATQRANYEINLENIKQQNEEYSKKKYEFNKYILNPKYQEMMNLKREKNDILSIVQTREGEPIEIDLENDLIELHNLIEQKKRQKFLAKIMFKKRRVILPIQNNYYIKIDNQIRYLNSQRNNNLKKLNDIREKRERLKEINRDLMKINSEINNLKIEFEKENSSSYKQSLLVKNSDTITKPTRLTKKVPTKTA